MDCMNLIGGMENVTLLNLFEKNCQEGNFRILNPAISSSNHFKCFITLQKNKEYTNYHTIS